LDQNSRNKCLRKKRSKIMLISDKYIVILLLRGLPHYYRGPIRLPKYTYTKYKNSSRYKTVTRILVAVLSGRSQNTGSRFAKYYFIILVFRIKVELEKGFNPPDK
jgi:hypothetical protein